MDLQVEAKVIHQQPNYSSFAKHVVFKPGEGNSDAYLPAKKVVFTCMKIKLWKKSLPKPQNSPGFVLQLDEATTQIYVVSTQKYILHSGLAIRRRTYPLFRVKSEWKLHVYGLPHKAFPQLYLFYK